MNRHLQPLLVGVDGSPATDGAVRAAVADARQLRALLRLVHVVPDRLPLATVEPVVSDGLSATGAGVLKRAAADLAALAPDVEVETQLRRGGIATQLAAAAEDAAALYVGRGSRPALERALQGNAAVGAAARAPCPVVCVPSGWEPQQARGEVVVALKSFGSSCELLDDAFAEAQGRGDRLVVLHSWKLPSVYDDIIVARVGPQESVRRMSLALEVLLRDSRLSYPGVEVELRVVHDEPVHALLTASRGADLLVLVRRAQGPGLGMLGGTGRAVLRGAECPVRVVPPGDTAAVPGRLLEQAGGLAT